MSNTDQSLQYPPELNAELAAINGQYYNVAYEIENFLATVPSTSSAGLAPKYLNDAKVNGFKLFFHFDSQVGLFADERYTNSALAYLKRIGQTSRYALLKKFIYLLSVINSQTPWMFQDIESGIKELWSTPLNNVLKDQIIHIKTLETIDDKIQGLMMIYRQIVWDESRDVWVVPINLRQFSMSIYVYDYRTFREDSDAKLFLQTQQNNDIANINHTLFDLGYCEFAIESASEAFESISNNASGFVTSSIHIQTKQMAISGLYKTLFSKKHTGSDLTANFFTGALGSDTNNNLVPEDLTDFDAWKENLKQLAINKIKSNQWYQTANEKYNFLTNPNTWKRELKNVIETGINKLEDKLDNAIAQLYMGNVYGFSLQDLAKYGDSGSIFNDIQQSTRKNSQITSITLDDNLIQKQGDMGNIFDPKHSASAILDDDRNQSAGSMGNVNK